MQHHRKAPNNDKSEFSLDSQESKVRINSPNFFIDDASSLEGLLFCLDQKTIIVRS